MTCFSSNARNAIPTRGLGDDFPLVIQVGRTAEIRCSTVDSQLHDDVAGTRPPREVAAQGEGDAGGRVLVRAGDLAHEQDDGHDRQRGGGDGGAVADHARKAWPIMPPPAAASTRKKVPSSSVNSRRHSCRGSLKSVMRSMTLRS